MKLGDFGLSAFDSRFLMNIPRPIRMGNQHYKDDIIELAKICLQLFIFVNKWKSKYLDDFDPEDFPGKLEKLFENHPEEVRIHEFE